MPELKWQPSPFWNEGDKAKPPFCRRCGRRMPGGLMTPPKTSFVRIGGTGLYVDETDTDQFSYTVTCDALHLECQPGGWLATQSEAESKCEEMATLLGVI